MRTIKKNEFVPFSADKMYALVNDIESYPLFLPWCSSVTILSRDEHEVKAKILIVKKGIQHAFSTLNRLDPIHKTIELNLLEGPFRTLKGLWKFEDCNDGGSIIHFDLEFELVNRLMDFALGPLLENIANNFIDAFKERAQSLYEKN